WQAQSRSDRACCWNLVVEGEVACRTATSGDDANAKGIAEGDKCSAGAGEVANATELKLGRRRLPFNQQSYSTRHSGLWNCGISAPISGLKCAIISASMTRNHYRRSGWLTGPKAAGFSGFGSGAAFSLIS